MTQCQRNRELRLESSYRLREINGLTLSVVASQKFILPWTQISRSFIPTCWTSPNTCLTSSQMETSAHIHKQMALLEQILGICLKPTQFLKQKQLILRISYQAQFHPKKVIYNRE